MAGPLAGNLQQDANGNIIPALNAVMGGDKGAAFDLYQYLTTGSSRRGTGPFSRFYEQYMAPLILGAMTAEGGGVTRDANGNPTGTRHALTDPTELFGKIQSGVRGQTDLFDLLGGISQRAMGDFIGSGGGDDYDMLRNFTASLAPLASAGQTPIYQDLFYGQQQDVFSDMYDQAMADPEGSGKRTDWDDFFQASPFFAQYYGNVPQGVTQGQARLAQRDPFNAGRSGDNTRLR